MVEESFDVWLELVAEIDVKFYDGEVVFAIRPRLVVAGVCVLDVAGTGAVLRNIEDQ